MDDSNTAASPDAHETLMVARVGLTEMHRLAEEIALILGPGDVIALKGDLGAGKTTFARFLIDALCGGTRQEVPSPTFSILQTYDTRRGYVCHFDFYRLSGPEEVMETGLDEAISDGITLIEWPERAEGLLPGSRLDIAIAETDMSDICPDIRHVTLAGRGRWATRLARLRGLRGFLDAAGWGAGDIAHLQGDASTRHYARLARPAARAILMDWPYQPDGPPIRDGRPYSAIAHLAEHVGPFVAIVHALRALGLGAPKILAADLDMGFLLLEDLGRRDFRAEIATGAAPKTPWMETLWRAAVDVLLHLRENPPPESLPPESLPPESLPPESLPPAPGAIHRLPTYDHDAFLIEVSLLTDWAVPLLTGMPAPAEAVQAFIVIWNDLLAPILAAPPEGWVLRDYHSPNLIWRPEYAGLARVGLVDFQDALRGPLAYDLVSLLQDARLTVPAALEAELLTYYCAEVRARDPSFDEDAFRRNYAILGAQRATKVLGIFARLGMRDGKRAYLAHIPRVCNYLERNLSRPELGALRAWYDRHLPPALREAPVDGRTADGRTADGRTAGGGGAS